MKIQSTQQNCCDVLTLTGRLDSFTSPILDQMLSDRILEDQIRFVVDMSNMLYISSAGLLTLINQQKSCKQLGGEIVLVAIPHHIFEAFQLSGFDGSFVFHQDLETAMAFFEDRQA